MTADSITAELMQQIGELRRDMGEVKGLMESYQYTQGLLAERLEIIDGSHREHVKFEDAWRTGAVEWRLRFDEMTKRIADAVDALMPRLERIEAEFKRVEILRAAGVETVGPLSETTRASLPVRVWVGMLGSALLLAGMGTMGYANLLFSDKAIAERLDAISRLAGQTASNLAQTEQELAYLRERVSVVEQKRGIQ